MSDLLTAVLAKAVPPVASLATGWVGAAISIRKRVKTLEDKLKTFEDLKLKEIISRIESQLRHHDLRISNLKGGMRLEMTSFKNDIASRLSVVESKLEDIESEVTRFRDSSTDFAKDAELADFIGEQRDQWNEIQRTIGEVIGELRALQNHLRRGS